MKWTLFQEEWVLAAATICEGSSALEKPCSMKTIYWCIMKSRRHPGPYANAVLDYLNGRQRQQGGILLHQVFFYWAGISWPKQRHKLGNEASQTRQPKRVDRLLMPYSDKVTTEHKIHTFTAKTGSSEWWTSVQMTELSFWDRQPHRLSISQRSFHILNGENWLSAFLLPKPGLHLFIQASPTLYMYISINK